VRSFSLGKTDKDDVIEAEPVAAATPRPVVRAVPGAAPGVPERETIICDDIQIRGDLISEEKLMIEGTIEGEVRGSDIEIGEKGRVTGSILSNTIVVRGRVEGTITATTVQLARTAVVEGDILHQGIGIEMGTHFDGRLKWNGEPSGTSRTVEALKQTAQQTGRQQPQQAPPASGNANAAPRQ